MKSRIWTKRYQWRELSNITQFFENWKCFKNYRRKYKIWVIVHNEIIPGKMDSFQTYPGLMTQKSVRWSRKSLPFMVGFPCVVDDNLTTLALRQPPIDDIFAERTASDSDMTMSRTVWLEPASVIDVNLSSRPVHNSRLFEVSHDNSFWSRAKKINPPQNGASIWRKLTHVMKANVDISIIEQNVKLFHQKYIVKIRL